MVNLTNKLQYQNQSPQRLGKSHYYHLINRHYLVYDHPIHKLEIMYFYPLFYIMFFVLFYPFRCRILRTEHSNDMPMIIEIYAVIEFQDSWNR